MLYSNIAKIEKAKETFVGHMKKRHLYTAAVLLTLSLSACGQDSENITESSLRLIIAIITALTDKSFCCQRKKRISV